MKSLFKKVIAATTCAALCLSATAASAASTGYFNTYSTVANNVNKSGCSIMQGFAVGSTYLYSAKINSDDTKAILYRTNKNTGAVTVLKNVDAGTSYFTSLGHANDMCLKNLDGERNLFVATMKANKNALVRLFVDGKNVTKKGNYKLTLDGVKVGMGAVDILEKTSTQVTFLFKKAKKFYTGTLNYAKTTGTIELTQVFKIKTSAISVNNKTVDASSYTHQGFSVEDNKIFVPLWNSAKPQQSIIAVYDITDATGTITSDKNLSFRVTSKTYPLFEIEGCGISSSDGKLYFNANRRLSDTDINHDAIMCFENYTFS